MEDYLPTIQQVAPDREQLRGKLRHMLVRWASRAAHAETDLARREAEILSVLAQADRRCRGFDAARTIGWIRERLVKK